MFVQRKQLVARPAQPAPQIPFSGGIVRQNLDHIADTHVGHGPLGPENGDRAEQAYAIDGPVRDYGHASAKKPDIDTSMRPLE